MPEGVNGLAAPLFFRPDAALGPDEWLGAGELAQLPGVGEELASFAPFSRSLQKLWPGDSILCGECGSSLDVAMRMANDGALPEWVSVLALSQKSGRGQLRREWRSLPGNIYAALRLPAQGAFSGWNAALLVGWMLAQAFNDMGYPLLLKWPNDLVVLRAGVWGKVGGILLEERNGVLLAGVGINISYIPDEGAMRRDSAMSATFLEYPPVARPYLTLWSDLVRRGKLWYENQFPTGRLANACADDMRAAEKLLAWKGCRVTVAEAAIDDGALCAEHPFPDERGEFSGRIVGLDERGCLRLVMDSGAEAALMSGSIRLLAL